MGALAHEIEHVNQWAIFGPGLPGLYGLNEGISQAAGQGSCWNVFEGSARFEAGGYDECVS